MAADLAQARKRGEHMHLALRKTVLAHSLHDLLAAASQFGEVQLPLLLVERTIAAFLDPVRQVFRHLFL